ncbi:MAG: class I SAM-dependent methyltransferase family protein [Candidatus Thorarchaeota archaeon]
MKSIRKKIIQGKIKINFIKLHKSDGQLLIELIKKLSKLNSIINKRYKIFSEDNFLFFPLTDNKKNFIQLKKSIGNKFPFEFVSREGILNPKFKYRSLTEALLGKIPEEYFQFIPKSYDIIGSIAIIDFLNSSPTNDTEFEIYKKAIANAIINVNKNVNSVFEKKSGIEGTYRLRNLVLLEGDDKPITTYKESNCIFKLDVKKTYFSPRLGYERSRISSYKMDEGDLIVDMFAGIGPFSIQIAKQHNVKIYAFDVNPQAYYFLKENIELNKLKGDIFPFKINVKELLNPINPTGSLLHNKIDRIIMNLPGRAINYLDVVCFLMKKSGGILHFYGFSKKPDPIEKIVNFLRKRLGALDWTADRILKSKIVKSYSPQADLVVIDANIKHLNP